MERKQAARTFVTPGRQNEADVVQQRINFTNEFCKPLDIAFVNDKHTGL